MAAIPPQCVRQVPRETERAKVRQQLVPAHLMVLFALALALRMRSLRRELLRGQLDGAQRLPVAGDAASSEARPCLGAMLLKRLQNLLRGPPAGGGQPGDWYRQWRIASVDGITLNMLY